MPIWLSWRDITRKGQLQFDPISHISLKLQMIISKQNVKKCHSQGSLPAEFRWIPYIDIHFHVSVLFLVFLQESLIHILSKA